MNDLETINAASNRIVKVIDDLRKEGVSANSLYIAFMDAGVRMGRFYAPKMPTHTILRNLARLALGMAKDEKDLNRVVPN